MSVRTHASSPDPGPATSPRTAKGRPRDESLDTAILDAALMEIAAGGIDGFSLAAVAKTAGTTRPAIYRRWPNKLSLAIDAVGHLAETTPPVYPGTPFEDLVAELEHFRHCICEAGALPLAGHMLTSGVDPLVLEQYQRRLVTPRRTRFRAILNRAVDAGQIDRDADLVVAGSLLTGSWYSFAIADTRPPSDWARRVAALVWTACGGKPTRAPSRRTTTKTARPPATRRRRATPHTPSEHQ